MKQLIGLILFTLVWTSLSCTPRSQPFSEHIVFYGAKDSLVLMSDAYTLQKEGDDLDICFADSNYIGSLNRLKCSCVRIYYTPDSVEVAEGYHIYSSFLPATEYVFYFNHIDSVGFQLLETEPNSIHLYNTRNYKTQATSAP